MNTEGLNFSVRSDLGSIGRYEDGEDIFAQHFYVVAEDDRGYRLAHFDTFPTKTVETGVDDEGYEYFNVCDVEAKAKAGVLEMRNELQDKAEIDFAHWGPVDPAYGSEAYLAEEPHIVAREMEEDRAH